MPFDTAAYLNTRLAGSQALAGGITSAASSVAGGIKNWQQEKKDDKAARAIFEALMPAEGEDGALASHPFGLGKDEFDGMSRADRIATVKGKVEALSVKNFISRMEADKEMRARFAAERASDAALARVMQSSRRPGAPALETPGVFGGGVAPALAPESRDLISHQLDAYTQKHSCHNP